MARIVNSRCVLAVRDLNVSTRYYTEVLGFSRDPIDAAGWSFLTRDNFSVMLGECANEKPAASWETTPTSRIGTSMEWTSCIRKWPLEGRC